MEFTPIEQIIRNYVALDDAPNSKGFWPVLCKICNDHGRKGKRAGFKFSGNAVGYNCFNCGHRASFDGDIDEPVSRDMVEVFNAWHIPETDWIKALNPDAAPPECVSEADSAEKLMYPHQLELPDFMYELTDDKSDDMAQIAIEYLTSRCIDWSTNKFFIVKSIPEAKRWYGRLIIPLYFRSKLIFWQGRDLLGIHQKKYLSPDVPKDAVMGGFDNIFAHTDDPLFITEGWFDSLPLHGVSVMGNVITKEQVKWLQRSKRRKVVIPDRFGDGHLLARQAVSLGWEVSTPDIGACKDINDAVRKYGSLYTIQSVIDNISSGFEAQVNIDLYCKKVRK